MRSTRNRAIAAIVTLLLLALPLAPAHALPQGPAAPAQAAEDGLFIRLWQWLAGLLGPAGAGGETSAVSTCSALGGNRGCAIDPNGGGNSF